MPRKKIFPGNMLIDISTCEGCIFATFDCEPSFDNPGYVKCPLVYGYQSSDK